MEDELGFLTYGTFITEKDGKYSANLAIISKEARQKIHQVCEEYTPSLTEKNPRGDKRKNVATIKVDLPADIAAIPEAVSMAVENFALRRGCIVDQAIKTGWLKTTRPDKRILGAVALVK